MKARRATSTHEALRRTTAPRKDQPKPRASGNRFSTINAMVDLHLAELTGTEAKVFIAMWRYERSKAVSISHQQLAALCGVDKRSTIRAVGGLQKRGLIRLIVKGCGDKQSCNQYQLAVPT